jgi:hypothetical protein
VGDVTAALCHKLTHALQQCQATARLLRPVLDAQNFTLPPRQSAFVYEQVKRAPAPLELPQFAAAVW